MKRLVFAFAGAAILGLTACSGNNQDQVNNAEMNQPSADELNQAAMDAANDAANAEAAALGAQQQQLENQSAADNGVNPSDAQEQNVSGM
jgi:predicted MFS family arabinose efflux permease